ncbi:MAG: hypothetical protein MUO58_03650 [Anaerolineales bacterium]|nr:hypothetical protein [Anaerolineales bacterium]
MRRVKFTVLLVVFLLLTTACGGALSLNPSATPMPTSTYTPEPKRTQMPTATLKPTSTLEPTHTPLACDADSLLKTLKTSLPFDEFAVRHNEIGEHTRWSSGSLTLS